MKTRLNSDHRRALIRLAGEIISAGPETKAASAAYKKAAPLVMRDLTDKYPVKDMKVLERYESASRDDCIRVQMTSGGVTQFKFAKGSGPLTPNRYGCHIYAVKADTTDAIQDWAAAVDAEKEALAKKMQDYRSLIDFSRTLEDVETIWPEAAKVRASVILNLPVALSDDVVARIAADVATRAAA